MPIVHIIFSVPGFHNVQNKDFMQTRFIQYKDNLPEMLRYATLHSEALFDNGLNGKMGITILFYEYSRIYKDLLYEQYAEELLDVIINTMALRPLGIRKGLSGIAWGIVYLHRENFLEGNYHEILEEVDDYLKANVQEAEKDILSYFAYRDGTNPNKDMYSKKEIIDLIWSNWCKVEK